MAIWKMKSGADFKVRSGHPWAFENELETGNGPTVPGDYIELQDNKGQFLARGYGNKESQIIFRALTFESGEKNIFSSDFILPKLLQAWSARKQLGFKASFRMCFGEGDFLPGLVIDYYRIENPNKDQAQVLAVQILTAGMDNIISKNHKIFEDLISLAKQMGLTELDWSKTAVVFRNDVNVRKHEGLDVEPSRFIKSMQGFEFQDIRILLNSVSSDSCLGLNCDLYQGQKTGFFLDQTYNIHRVAELVRPWLESKGKNAGKVRVLDLCSYVGHWSAQLGLLLKTLDADVEVTAVDVSNQALAFAKKNVEALGVNIQIEKRDVLEQLQDITDDSYDIVIADPPAFIKAKKDIPTGKHAYLKLNTQAFRIAKPGGLVVSCSCSGLLNEDDFKDAIRKAGQRSGKVLRCVARGGHAADHPEIMAFTEGHYLKMYTHLIQSTGNKTKVEVSEA